MRVGFGYDIHRLVPGRRLVLGGVEIAHPTGLLGHSDADVVVHAVMDALLGACGLGDIGQWFPDTDASLRDISSLELLSRVRSVLASRGWVVQNIDTTVVAEAPRLAGHIPAMRKVLATRLEIQSEAVNIKATTNEGLGPVGRGEGISAFAVALVSRSA